MKMHRGAGNAAMGLALVAALAGCAGGMSISSMSTAMTWGQRGKKAYDMQQKLAALNFTVKADAGKGELAYIASAKVKGFPISVDIDLANLTMPARAVSVAGVSMSLTGEGPLSFAPGYKAALQTAGMDPAGISEAESTLGTAVSTINSLSSS